MTAFAGKIRDFFGDIGFELELMLSRVLPKRKKKEPVAPAPPAPPAQAAPSAPSAPSSVASIGHAAARTPLNVPSESPSRLGFLKAQIRKLKKRSAPVGSSIETGTNALAASTGNKLPWSLRLARLSAKERLFFFDQLATLIDSGVTLMTSLQIIQNQSQSKSLKKIYDRMMHNINGGMSLADSMRDLRHLFPEMMCALVEAGEKSGNLKAVLAELVAEMEGHQDFVRKVTGAMFYPAILIFLCLALVTGMMIFVIPRISVMYKEANVALPILTQKVIAFSDFMTGNWQLLLISVVGGLLAIWLLVHFLKLGRLLWEKFVFHVPVFGRIALEKQIMIFAANLGMLMQSGVLISDALAITAKTMGNLHYERELIRIRQGVIIGQGMSTMMGLAELHSKEPHKNKLFPLQVAQLVHIGETTGKFGKMLLKVRDNFKKAIDYKLKNISNMLEPIMIFVVAALVGSILLAVMLPFFYIGTTIT